MAVGTKRDCIREPGAGKLLIRYIAGVLLRELSVTVIGQIRRPVGNFSQTECSDDLGSDRINQAKQVLSGEYCASVNGGDHAGGNWGSRGRRFKSGQPDETPPPLGQSVSPPGEAGGKVPLLEEQG